MCQLLIFIRDGSDTSKRASAWLEGRSLLAGDEWRGPGENRLQAGSYKSEKKQQASGMGVGLIKCLGACPEDVYLSGVFLCQGLISHARSAFGCRCRLTFLFLSRMLENQHDHQRESTHDDGQGRPIVGNPGSPL
jgi:hypothetical protein